MPVIIGWITIIGSDRRPETNQGTEGKIVRLRSGRVTGRVRDRVRDKDRRSEPDRPDLKLSILARVKFISPI